MATKITKSELKALIREALREELGNSKSVLNEDEDLLARLRRKGTPESPWYTEYFAVGPACLENSSGKVVTPEDFDDYWEDFEDCLNDVDNYSIIPIVFGPHMDRTYSKEQHATLDDALDYVIENLYSDSDLSSDIKSYSDLFNVALMEPIILTNSATFIVAYGPDVQDSYGCYIRVSQKPLGSNQQLAKHYKGYPAKSGPHLLANLMDTGLVGEEYSSYPNFDAKQYAWQAK